MLPREFDVFIAFIILQDIPSKVYFATSKNIIHSHHALQYFTHVECILNGVLDFENCFYVAIVLHVEAQEESNDM